MYNGEKVIDSRDVIKRIEELQGERDDYTHDEDGNLTNADWPADFPHEAAELAALEALQSEAEGYCADWQHGAALIRYDYFTEYAMDMLSDIGDLPKEIPWYIIIDEEATAANVREDYTEVDFGGVSYYIR